MIVRSVSEWNVLTETMPYLWSENAGIDEIKQRLLSTKFELTTARTEASAERRKYEETIKHLFKLLKTVCQERDEARDHLQLLLKNFQPSTPAKTSCTTPQVDHHPQPPGILKYKTKPPKESTKKSYMSSKAFPDCSCDLSLASLHSNHDKLSSTGFSQARTAESSNLALPKQPKNENRTRTTNVDNIGFSRDNMVDSASLMIDKLVWGKPLPQKGRLLRTVTEVGPLLQTLLVAPLPQWQNPPSLSSCFHVPKCSHGNDSSTNVDDKESVNQNGVIPTSLSLAFPGNSCGASLPYASCSGLSVKNEPMPCVVKVSDMMHNHILTAKKRKLM